MTTVLQIAKDFLAFFTGDFRSMNKAILLLALLFTPQIVSAQEATPTVTSTATITATPTVTATATATPTITPTPTVTCTATPAWAKLSGETTREMHSIVMVNIAATAMPTAYSTPQIPKGIPLKYVDIVNKQDCAVACSLDGGGADNYEVPAGSAWAPPLAELKMHISNGVNCRSEAACSSGNLYMSGAY